MKRIAITPIGIIHSPFKQAAGTPIQPAKAEGAEGTVEVFKQYAEALKDLDGFERVWLVYFFHKAPEFKPVVVPFLDTAQRGLFATRAPCRPNPIGISPVKLLRIEGNILHVADIDVLDGTPLLDIKPYSPRFDAFETSRSGWLDQTTTGQSKADDRFAEPDAEK